MSKKIQENVDGENYNLVDPYDKEADDYKLNEDANMETLKPVVKEDRNNYNYYNNIKLYNEDLFEKTAKIKKSLNPYESIYKFSSQINKEKDKKSKKDKEKINNNNNNSSNLNINNNSNKNININTSNNYSSSISHISKDKESNHNNVQTRTNNFIAKDLLAISEMQQNQQNKNNLLTANKENKNPSSDFKKIATSENIKIRNKFDLWLMSRSFNMWSKTKAFN